jgi:hypothetical protein
MNRMTLLVPLALVCAACTYNPKLPSGVISCAQGKTCPSGMTCLPSAGDPTKSYCFAISSLGGDGGFTAIDGPPLSADAAPAGGDGASPVDAAPLSPDLAPPADLGAIEPDADTTTPDAGGPCPSSRGPAMVQADKFCIDSTEVTNLQYQAFLTAKGTDTGGQIAACAGNTDFAPKPSVDFPFAAERAGFPVVNVDWCDAVAFCQWAGKRLCGRIGGGSVAFTFQLDVSVNQWADACSDAGKKKFPYGDTYNANACYVKGGLADHVAAGSTKTCEGGVTGLFDMVGNVDEWIDSCRTTAAGDTCLVMSGSFQSPENPQPGCGYWYEDKRMAPNQRRGFRCCN